jgi:hypothetical protein
VAHENLINQREYEATHSFIEEYCLAQHDPKLMRLLQAIRPDHPGSIDLRLWQSVRRITGPFEAFHRDHPFVVAPPGILDGRPFTTPLRQLADDQSITLDDHELAEHVGIFGRSGGGKTTCAQQFAHEAYRRNLSVLTIDSKEDARAFPVLYPDTIVVGPGTPIPLLEPPSWLEQSAARPQLITPLKQTMWGVEGLQQVATESHARTFARHSRPRVLDWRDEVRGLAGNKDTYTRRDRCEGLALRLDRLVDQYPGIATTRVGEGIPLEALCTHPVYFGFGLHTEIEAFLTQWLLELRFSYNRANGLRVLNTLVLLDESNLLVHDKTISAQAPLVATFPLLREFGIAVCLTANNYRTVPPPIRSSLYLQIAMNLTDATEATEIARTFGHKDRQREYHDKKLTLGTCIAKFGDRWKHPVVARFEPLQIPKSVDAAAWQAALDRTNALARTAAAREENTGWTPPSQAPTATASREQPTRATDTTTASVTTSSAQERSPDLSPNAGHETSPNTSQEVIPPNAKHRLTKGSMIAPNRSETRTSPNAIRTHVALNQHATALLQDVGDHPFTLCTQAYRRCRLLFAQGDRARAQLERLGFLYATRVTCGRGRGKTGISLHLTAAGWNGRTPVKGLRGGSSVQHSFCVFELSRRIPGSTIEEYLGTKPVDLCIPFNTEWHEPFYRAIMLLTGKTPHLDGGDIIAVEIEISQPRSTRNAVKNAAVCVALTILAVADREPERLALNLPPNAIVVDVYALLDALRTTEKQ